MRRDFQMPDIGEGIAEVEIIEWHIGLGDQIQPDQIVATIQTDKSVVEMPTPLGGTVVFLGAEAGDLLAVGSVLIAVEAEGEVTAEVPPGAGLASASSLAHTSEARLGARDAVAESTSRAEEPSSIRVKAAPSVRRLAAERGVHLGVLTRGLLQLLNTHGADALAQAIDAAFARRASGIFNVADVAITLGAVLLVLPSLAPSPSEAKAQA